MAKQSDLNGEDKKSEEPRMAKKISITRDTQIEDIKQKKKGKGHKRLKIAAVAIIIILGALLVLYEMYGSLPSSILSAVSSGKQLNATTLQGIIFQKVNAAPMFSVNYTGNITIKSDPPFSVSFIKYYNETWYSFISYNFTFPTHNLTVFNSSSTSIILLIPNSSNNAYGTLCVGGIPVGIGTSFGGYRCFQTYGNETQEAAIANLFFNVSSLSNVTTTSYGLSQYNGQPCYLISGIGTIDVNGELLGGNFSAETPMSLDFRACLSAQYDIPLNIQANMNAANGASIYIDVSESALGTTTNGNEVTVSP